MALLPRRLDLRLHKFDAAVSLVCCAMLGFFGWHATQGPRGFSYTEKLAAESGKLAQQRDDARGKREQLEARVSLLRPEGMDPDMLDEVARRVLLVGKSSELQIILSR